MPRLIVLLLIAAALALLAIQNMATSITLVLLGREIAAVPLGLLLVGAVAIGCLVTLVLYVLVSLQRPPESKYRPMGRRVPYPSSPGSSTLPPSGPPYQGPDSVASSAHRSTTSSTAFVPAPSEPQDTLRSPAVPQQPAMPQPDSSPDSLSGSGGYSSAANTVAQTAMGNLTSELSEPPASSDSVRSNSVRSNSASSDMGSAVGLETGATSVAASEKGEQASPKQTVQNWVSKLQTSGKQVLSNASGARKGTRKGAEKASEAERLKAIGDDWGELRTPSQINSWEVLDNREPSQSGNGRNFFDFFQLTGQSSRQGNRQSASDRRYDTRYDSRDGESLYDDLDQGWEVFDDYQTGDYQAGDYRDDYRGEGREGRRDRTRYEFRDDSIRDYGDDYGGYSGAGYRDYEETPGDRPPRYEDRRTYGEAGIYGDSSNDRTERYRSDDDRSEGYPLDDPRSEEFADEEVNEIGPDGIYEADYRVIVPPSKPLDESDLPESP